jgi:hypothetical protein
MWPEGGGWGRVAGAEGRGSAKNDRQHGGVIHDVVNQIACQPVGNGRQGFGERCVGHSGIVR